MRAAPLATIASSSIERWNLFDKRDMSNNEQAVKVYKQWFFNHFSTSTSHYLSLEKKNWGSKFRQEKSSNITWIFALKMLINYFTNRNEIADTILSVQMQFLYHIHTGRLFCCKLTTLARKSVAVSLFFSCLQYSKSVSTDWPYGIYCC